ncbi:hypothetical protein GPALN_001827 [Globodera pallida]|nr:hypothetical protein GPALN_001827 [Globodera pallida]
MTEENNNNEIEHELRIETSPTMSGKLKKPLLNQITKMDPVELRHLVANMQARLDQVEDMNVDLRVQLANAVEEHDTLKKSTVQQQQEGTETELKHIYDQLLYKDTRIMELNQTIMDRERRIIDLQEAFSEQGQVARSKQLAVSLLGKRLQELDAPRERRDIGTETDDDSSAGTRATARRQASRTAANARSPQRNASPGRAIPQLLRMEDGCSSYTTTDTLMDIVGIDAVVPFSTSALSMAPRKKTGTGGGNRKKVTFFDTDGTSIEQQRRNHQHVDGMVRRIGTPPPVDDQQLKSAMSAKSVAGADYEELLAENDQLRRIISEMEQQQLELNGKRSNEDNMISSTLILKAKAAAQVKIHELEALLAQKQLCSEAERSELQAAIDQLNASREWALEENAKLLSQLEASRQKSDDLHGELDASLETSAIFRRRLDDNAARMEALYAEMHQSRAQTQQALDDKNIMGAEVERLKDAIFAQDEFIGMLEGDLLVYEAHVGILRDSLGATKKEERQHIKSKAFTAKLNALEMEKREIAKRNNDEKLRAKALTVKVRCLEEERDELRTRLRQYEREYGISREQPLQAQQQSQKQVRDQTPPVASTVLDLDDNAESSTCVVDDCSQQINADEQSKQQQQLAVMTEQLQLQAQHIDAIQALNRETEQHVQHLELELMSNRESVQKFVESIASRQIPSSFDNILLVNDGTVGANLGSVERLVDLLLRNVGMLNEARTVLEQQLELMKAQIERKEAEQVVREQEFHDESEQFRVQLQHCQGQIDVAQRRIDNLTRTEAEMARELGTRQRELSTIKVELDACREQKLVLEEQSVELSAQIDALNGTNLALSSDLQQANTEKASLSITLSGERERLDRLISLLTEIGDRFRSATTVDGTALSSESLDVFMRRIEAKSPVTSAEEVQLKTLNLVGAEQHQSINVPGNAQHLSITVPGDELHQPSSIEPVVTSVFTKHVAVQATANVCHPQLINNMAQTLTIAELNKPLMHEMERQRAHLLTEHGEQVAALGTEIEQLQQQLRHMEQEQFGEMKHRRYLEQQLTVDQKRAECLELKLEQLERELMVSRAELSEACRMLGALEEDKFAMLAQLDGRGQLELEIGTLRTTNEQLNERIAFLLQREQESATMDEVEENALNTVCQSLAYIDPEFCAPIDTAHQQPLMLDAGTQSSNEHLQLPITAMHADGHQSQLERDHLLDDVQAGADHQQQHRQLLLECIHDRQQFEHDLGQNVQQLLILKSELESSVDVLRAEIWALNEELKKKIDERVKLSQRLCDADSQLAIVRAENVELLAKLKESEQNSSVFREAMDQHQEVQAQLGIANQRIDELCRKEEEMLHLNENVSCLNANVVELETANGMLKHEIQELTDRICQLQRSLQEAKSSFCSWRTDLHALRTQQQSFITNSDFCIDSIREVTGKAVEQLKVARLTTKSLDVEALVRENQLLIETNARLQTEKEQFNNGGDGVDGDKLSQKAMEEEQEACLQTKLEQYNDSDCNAGDSDKNDDKNNRKSTDEEKEEDEHQSCITSDLAFTRKHIVEHRAELLLPVMNRIVLEADIDVPHPLTIANTPEVVTSNQQEEQPKVDKDYGGASEVGWGWDEEGGEEVVVQNDEEENDRGKEDEHVQDDQKEEEEEDVQEEEEEDVQADQLGDWNWGEENEENASEEKDGGEKHSNEYDDDAEAEADWGWEREGGGGASQDDQKGNKGDQKSEESSCNEKREQIKPGDIERKPASTSESNKSIFDNLVDWAWGDK